MEIILYPLAILFLLFLVWVTINSLAKIDVFHTTMESDDGKIVTRNGKAIRLIHSVEDMKKESPNSFIITIGVELQGILARLFGWYWIGNPFTDSIQEIPIQKSRPNDNGSGPDDWVTVDAEKTLVKALHRTIQRTFVLRDVDVAGGVPVSFKIPGTLKVFDFYIPTNVLDGDFFTKIEELLRAQVRNMVSGMTPRECLSIKGNPNALKELLDPEGEFNLSLYRETGMKFSSAMISDLKLPPDVEKALNAETMKKEEGLGVVAEAQAEATGILLVGNARAEASGIEFQRMVDALVKNGADPNLAAEQVARVLTARAQPDMTTKVEGGGAQVVIQPKDKGEKK